MKAKSKIVIYKIKKRRRRRGGGGSYKHLLLLYPKKLIRSKKNLFLSKNLMQFDAATLLNNYTYIFKNLKKFLQFGEATWRNHGI